ncbi:hypothetical protein Acr_00g0034740 [Actinidia rufa]|uniref:RING-type E3 ubiquitin transferase n=1 Tax=Actinidia rufa TaxID=165716 RepID=A0A7J0DG25_9ERIC|nr:hypothetical protein Acr_00g0034740 [Actinidia rufa]
MIAFFTIPPLFFFIVFVITHCYQRLGHASDLDPELPDLEAGQVSLAHPPPPSTTAADHNRHNLGRFRNKIGTHRLVLPVDREYDRSTTDIHECAICLEEFRAGETCRVLLVCDHFFHPECIGLWLVENQTCPICRRERKTEVEIKSAGASSIGTDIKREVICSGGLRRVGLNRGERDFVAEHSERLWNPRVAVVGQRAAVGLRALYKKPSASIGGQSNGSRLFEGLRFHRVY